MSASVAVSYGVPKNQTGRIIKTDGLKDGFQIKPLARNWLEIYIYPVFI